MKKLFSFFLILFFFSSPSAFPQTEGRQVVVENGLIRRLLEFENGKITTLSLRLKGCPQNFVSIEKAEPGITGQQGSYSGEFRVPKGANPDEFSFYLNDLPVTGKSGWNLSSVDPVKEKQGSGYQFVLNGTRDFNRDVRLAITYLTYPDVPVIRKKITFENTGKNLLKIESLDIESLTLGWNNTHNVVYNQYARYKRLGPFTGDWDDPAVIVHDQYMGRGMVIGNEAPGVMKRTTACLDGRTVTAGLTHKGQDYPFRKWLRQGEKWESPWTFIALYTDRNPETVIEGPVSDFVRKYMGIRLAEIPVKPTFVYNTWNPFRREVNEKLIMELADAAAACGVEEFVIDDGWQVGFGDWEIDYKKFPGGLKSVFDYIKSKGMKPGLWMSMGAASVDSKVYKEHPEWFVRDKNGEITNLHSLGQDRKTACFTTGWKDYIKSKVLGLVKEHGLEYIKLDFAIVTSAYMFDRSVSGCYANGHPHKDREESLLEIYRRAWQLFDELHAEAPDLFIDCTFETMGALQMIDYDMCKHAEGNWLSNFEEAAPFGSLRVRQMAWWRSPVIPATALVIGNQTLDDPDAMFSFKSLAGSLPIMLGDPRKLNAESQKEFREMAGWLKAMQIRHNIMLFRQDLPGFGEPTHTGWDGFQRFNTETKSGGIIGVFRQNSSVREQWVTLTCLHPDRKYKVVLAPFGKLIAEGTGKELREKGFRLVFENQVQGELYEVEPAEKE